jgi:hypothetical protein
LRIDYFSLRSQDALKLLLDTTVKAFQQSLDLTQALYETGIDSEEALAQAQNSLGGSVAAAGTPTGYCCVGTACGAGQRTNWYRESGIFSNRYVKRHHRVRDFVHQPMIHLAQPFFFGRTLRGGDNF